MTLSGRARMILVGAALLTSARLTAQAPRLDITPPSSATDAGATVSATNLFAEADVRELVRSGFPASLRFRLELWRAGGFLNDLESSVEWEYIVQYDPSAQRYGVIRRQNGKVEEVGTFATLTTSQAVLERPARTTLAPEIAGARYYYTLALNLEALSVSDMDQLERWLRGTRSGTAASAVGSGLRTLILRMLGGEKKRYNATSRTFVAEK
jgi:hypothetical protein